MSEPENFQSVHFPKDEDYFRTEITSKNVTILTSTGHHGRGSSNLKLKNIVDYNWESRYYPGQLIAVHKGKQFVAYSIKVPTAEPSSPAGVVRIFQTSTGKRGIIKGMRGEVHDLGFAHLDSEIIIACIDEFGNVLVHSIKESGDNLISTSLMEYVENETRDIHVWHQLVWCPYVPDADDDYDDEAARLFVTTHKDYVRMWRVDGDSPQNRTVLDAGTSHVNGSLVTAAVAPDGTAVALANTDGVVFFYQIMNKSESPKCIHKWHPNSGKPLSCLYFLDNCKNHNIEASFWKFALTGADYNTVIKIWSCTSWTCLQTINFTADIDTNLILKPALDLTSNFLLLSNAKSQCLYVLELDKEGDEFETYCKAITELKLQLEILSFAIVDAGVRKKSNALKNLDEFDMNGSSHSDEDDDFDDKEILDSNSGQDFDGNWYSEVLVRGFVVQPRGVQNARLSYPISVPHIPISSPQDDPFIFARDNSDRIEEPGLLDCSEQLNKLLRSQGPASNPTSCTMESQHSLNLMTPEAFRTDAPQNESREELITTCPNVKKIEEIEEAEPKFTSENSSPSREVQQILCPLTYSSPVLETSWPSISIPHLTAASDRVVCNDVAAAVTNGISDIEQTREDNHNIVKTNHELKLAIEQLSEAIKDQSRLDAIEFKIQLLTDAVSDIASRAVANEREAAEKERESEAALTAAAGAAAARAAGAGAARALEPLVRALQQELAAKLTATDTLLTENIEKLVSSKKVTEGIAQSVSKGVSDTLIKSLRDSWIETLNKTLLPAMQQSFAETFNQLNIIFAQGAKEYAKQAEEAARLAVERASSASVASLHSALIEHTAALQRHETALQAVVRNSPAPRHVVTSLLEAGDPDAAFQRALSAADLPLVVSLCRTAEPLRAVPALRPPVLLSLVQQLGADLGSDTQLKKIWLEEAVKRLSREAPALAHAPIVLGELLTRLRAASASTQGKDLGLLQFVVEGIVRSLPSN